MSETTNDTTAQTDTETLGAMTAEDAAKDMPTGPDGAELPNLTKAIVVAVRRMGGDPSDLVVDSNP